MLNRLLRALLRPWLLVMLGIMLNIIAALLTHELIAQNNAKIHQLETEINKIDSLIDSYWQENQTIERKQEFILVLLQINPQPSARSNIYQYVFDYLMNLNSTYAINAATLIAQWQQQDVIQPLDVVKMTEIARSHITDEINNMYFDKLTLQQQMQPLQQHNALLTNVALFLQLMGLILVLSRDWQWRGYRK